MLKINLKESYAEFKKKIKAFFADKDAAAKLDSFSDENSEINCDFSETVDFMIHGACGKSKAYDDDNWSDMVYEDAKNDKNKMITKIAKFLSFDNLVQAQTYLPPTYGIENDYFFKALNAFFYALLMVDPTIEARFEVAYMLSKNKIEVGVAGHSEKLGKDLPYYLTYIDMTKKLIIVDPIKGTAETITFDRPISGLRVNDKLICFYSSKFGWVLEDGGIEFYKPYDKGIRDYKAAERKVKKESGKKVKDTCWQTVSLGSYKGSAKYMRVHSLIALMVWNLEIMKFGLMEANSIFTIDHINSKHDCNNVDNLALLTRQHNCSKGDKDNASGFYIDYFSYLSGGSLV